MSSKKNPEVNSEEVLQTTLQRLENSTRKIVSTRGYNRDAKNLKALEELIREQLTNENTRSSNRSSR